MTATLIDDSHTDLFLSVSDNATVATSEKLVTPDVEALSHHLSAIQGSFHTYREVTI